MNRFLALLCMYILCTQSMHAPTPASAAPEAAGQKATHGKKEVTPDHFDKEVYQWSKVIAETIHLLKHKYYQLVDPEAAFTHALGALTHALDPHSTFLDKKAYEAVKESIKGELCGIGVIIDHNKEIDDEYIRINDTIPTGPADKAGIKAEDKILEVDGQTVRGMSLEEAISKIKGKKNTTVQLLIQRSDTTRHLPFTITRDVVAEPNALCYHFIDQNIYYLCLNLFTENSVGQMEHLMQKITNSKARGFILDLRNNSGGLLNAVIDIAGIFLPHGSLIVSTKGRDNIELERYATTRQPLMTNAQVPIFIIVNNYTASAAEILAGCLQIYAHEQRLNRPIFIVGTDTFGKGSVQELIPLGTDTSCDCAIKLTTRLYFLPDNSSIQGNGVKPDFVIEPRIPISEETMWFNQTFGRESSLKNAIKNDQEASNPHAAKLTKKQEKKQAKKEQSWHEKKRELIAADYMILSTVRLMCMFDTLRMAMPDAMRTHTQAVKMLKKLYLPQDKANITELVIDK
ncbi:MAG: S41 family peptidase [Candidatus Babeliales bacterium]